MVGGGPAGLGAAIGAAKAGADVVLVERYGFLGGNATAALVMPLMSFHNEVRSAREADEGGPLRLLPTDHGPGEPMVAGVLDELLQRLVAAGGAVAPTQDTGYTVPIDPELYKLALLDMLDDAGVHFLFHSFASGVVDGGSGLRDEVRAGRDRGRRRHRLHRRRRRGRPGGGPVLAGARAGRAHAADDADVPDGGVRPRALRALRGGAPRPVARGARPLGADRGGAGGGRAGAAARGHPLLRDAARARGEREQHARGRARDRPVGDHARGVGCSPADARDRSLPADARARLRGVVQRAERQHDRGARDAPDPRATTA